MKFCLFIGNIFQGLRAGVSRFAYAFFSSIALWAVLSYVIVTEEHEELCSAVCFGLVLGLLLSVLAVLVTERTRHAAKSQLISLTSALPAAACAVIIYNVGLDNEYLQMGYFGLIIASVALIAFTVCRGRLRESVVGHLFKSLVFAGAISGILCAGFSVCIAAADFLIFDFNDIYKLYFTVCLFMLLVVGLNLFLSGIPQKDDAPHLPTIFKILVLYVALPVYLLLVAILYVYFLKILVTWHLPSGEINWFASYASLFYVFFLFCLRPYTEKLALLFKKYASFFILPVIAIQTLAIVIRINAYGFTTPRFISCALVLIAFLFALLDILTKKPERVFLAAAVITLIICLTPFNLIDLPKNDQINRFHSALVRNNMLNADETEVLPNPDVSATDREIIISSASYLRRAAGKLPEYVTFTNSKDFLSAFGFSDAPEAETGIYFNYSGAKSYDISEYSDIHRVYLFSKGDSPESKDEVDAEAVIDRIYKEYGDNNPSLPLIVLDDTRALMLEHASGQYSAEHKLEYYDIDAYILTKEKKND